MHMSYCTNTMPSGRCWLAPVGHTGTHGGSAQCWQPIGRNVRRTSGYSPTSTSTTWRQNTPGGSAFSSWQATVHVWQPTHLRRDVRHDGQRRLRAPRVLHAAAREEPEPVVLRVLAVLLGNVFPDLREVLPRRQRLVLLELPVPPADVLLVQAVLQLAADALEALLVRQLV